MVKVYFETEKGAYCELVATFESEDLYMLCSHILEEEAKRQRCIVTESIED